MPFDFDTSNPTDTYLIPSYPQNERDFRAAVEGSVDVEHDHSEGRHKFGSGTTISRDAITTWVVGSLWFNTTSSPAYLERCISLGPTTWEPVECGAPEVPHLNVRNVWSKTQLADWVEVTPGAGVPNTIAISLNASPLKYVTVVADSEVQVPTSISAGEGATFQLEVIQDGTGGWDVTFEVGGADAFVSPGAATPSIATAAGAKTMLWFSRNQAGDWIVSSSPGIAAF